MVHFWYLIKQYGKCKPEKENGQEKSFAALSAGMVDRDIISVVDTPNIRDKRHMANVISWQQTASSRQIFFVKIDYTTIVRSPLPAVVFWNF